MTKKLYINSKGEAKDPSEMQDTYLQNAYAKAKGLASKGEDNAEENVAVLHEELVKRNLI